MSYVPFSGSGGTVWSGDSINNPFPRASSGLYGADKKLAESTGFVNKWGDTWTSGTHPGQYLSTADVQALAKKQQDALRISNPGNYNPGVDYLSLLAPYTGAGSSSSANGTSLLTEGNQFKGRLNSLMANPDSIANTESYKFRLGQGQQALQRSAAAKGMLGSGNVLAALMDYGQGMASTEYGNEFDRLLKASQGQDTYNLGVANANNQKAQTQNSLAALMLEAGKAKSGDYWRAQDTANRNALATGYLNPQYTQIW